MPGLGPDSELALFRAMDLGGWVSHQRQLWGGTTAGWLGLIWMGLICG